MKRVLGIVAIILICIGLSAVVTMGDDGKIPEPSRAGKNIPNDVVWDDKQGMYKPVESSDPTLSSGDADIQSTQWFGAEDEWVEKNKNSTNPLDKAMIKWINNRKLNAYKSYYSSDEDETFKEITKLGIKYLPEILDRIKKDDGIQTGVLMDAFSKISDIDALKRIDVSDEGKKTWKQKCNEIMKNTPAKVKSVASKVKNNDIENAKNEIKESGIFAAPFAIDEIKNGNSKMESAINIKNFTDDELRTLREMVQKSTN